ncbi:MAG: RidA family protein [Gemmatimonadota bacterium]
MLLKTAGLVLVCTIVMSATAIAQKPEFRKAPGATAALPFSEAVKAGNTLYLSGMIGVVPGSLKLAEGGIVAETRQTMENIRTALARNGGSLNDVVKCLVMLADMSEWGKMNEVYATFFPNDKPARSSFGASGLALNARVEIECIAVLEK